MKLKLFIFRHGSTFGNVEGRYIGTTDDELCETGINEIEATKKELESNEVFKSFQNENCVIYVSPMKRARHTASLFFPLAKQIVVDDFAEMHFGIFENKSADFMLHDEKLAPLYQKWVDGGCVGKCPQGESKQEFCDRVCNALKNLELEENSTVAIVCHGGTIMALLERFAVEKKSYFQWRTKHGGFRLVEIEL